jgi:hypothetical protein
VYQKLNAVNEKDRKQVGIAICACYTMIESAKLGRHCFSGELLLESGGDKVNTPSTQACNNWHLSQA